MKWRLRSCPRCGGDIMIYDDYEGWHETCLQCGYSTTLEDQKVLPYNLERDIERDSELIHVGTQ
jgi:DNA-directed RNA polymerase subunit M/transcription elongation factor TFIIS